MIRIAHLTMGLRDFMYAALALVMVASANAQDGDCAQSKTLSSCSSYYSGDYGVVFKVTFDEIPWTCDYIDEESEATLELVDALELALAAVHDGRAWFKGITVCEISAGSTVLEYAVTSESALTPLQATQTGFDLADAVDDGNLELDLGGTYYPASSASLVSSSGDGPEEVAIDDACYYFDAVEQCGSGFCKEDNGAPVCECPEDTELPYCSGDETTVLLAVLIALAVIAAVIIILLITLCCLRCKRQSGSPDQQKFAHQPYPHTHASPYSGVMGGTLMAQPYNTMKPTMIQQPPHYGGGAGPGYGGGPTSVAILQPIKYGQQNGRNFGLVQHTHGNRVIQTTNIPRQNMILASPQADRPTMRDIGGDVYQIVEQKGGQVGWIRA